MKNLLITLLFINIVVLAQGQTVDTISVTTDKTVHIQFNSNIVYCDLGSSLVAASIVPSVPSLLRIKAKAEFSTPTNVSIMTADHVFTTFIVKYSTSPEKYLHQIFTTPKPGNNKKNILEVLNTLRPSLSHIGTREYRLEFNVNSLYIVKDKIYITLAVKNKSNISYQAETINFLTEDITKNRTANQRLNLEPLASLGTLSAAPRSQGIITFCLDKLTLPNDKLLRIDIFEKNGNRNVTLSLTSQDIINALPYDE